MENRVQLKIGTGVFLGTLIFLYAVNLATGFGSSLFISRSGSGGMFTGLPENMIPVILPVWKIFLAPILAFTGSAGLNLIVLVLFILVIGGSFSVLNSSGIIPALVSTSAARFGNRPFLFLLVNVALFTFMGSVFGILEETAPLILLFIPLVQGMGGTKFTGVAVPYVSAGVGFAAATLNPFTVGTAQRLAGLPIFSGIGLRIPVYLIASLLALIWLWFHSELPRTPEMKLSDNRKTVTLHPGVRNGLWWIFSGVATLGLLIGLGPLIPVLQEYAFPLIMLIFLVMGLGAGWAAGLKGSVLSHFFKGLLTFSPAIALLMCAAGVGYLLDEANLIGSILQLLLPVIRSLTDWGAALALYLVQMVINFFVPSGSGQAILTMPILLPIGQAAGLSAQTVVLAFQFGDGFSNLLWPTNALLLIALSIGGISYRRWLRFILPLQAMLFALCAAVLILSALKS